MLLSAKTTGRVGEIFAKSELGDPRRSRRAAKVAEALAESPNQSLPRALASTAELEGGYRLLSGAHCDFTALMAAVQAATCEEASKEERVLVIHDTTDLKCLSASAEEVGFLPTGKAGFYIHHALCVSTQSNRPLGVIWSEVWGRAQRSRGRGKRLSGSALAKLEDRESDRWLHGVTHAHEWLKDCTQVVHVFDTEADSYRVFAHLFELQADFVVRLRHDRRVMDGYLSEVLAAAPIKLDRLVDIGKRKSKRMPNCTHQGRPARMAHLQIRATTIEILPPKHLPQSEPVQLNVIQVLEEKPPAGEKPISWVIATALPIRTKADIAWVVDIYRARWQVEEFHKALKTGCALEKRQLESFDAITSLLALCYPIANELLHLRSRSRDKGLPASDVLRPSLLDCLRAHPKARKLGPNPSAEEALNVIAGLGGHIKNNGPPGWQTLGGGYTELITFERGWLAAIAHRNL